MPSLYCLCPDAIRSGSVHASSIVVQPVPAALLSLYFGRVCQNQHCPQGLTSADGSCQQHGCHKQQDWRQALHWWICPAAFEPACCLSWRCHQRHQVSRQAGMTVVQSLHRQHVGLSQKPPVHLVEVLIQEKNLCSLPTCSGRILVLSTALGFCFMHVVWSAR